MSTRIQGLQLEVGADQSKAQLTFTYGGLKCDLDSRVLSTTGVPIPGRIPTLSLLPQCMTATNGSCYGNACRDSLTDVIQGLYAAGELSGLFYNEVSAGGFVEVYT